MTRNIVRSFSARFNAWLTKVGEENRPRPHQFDHLPVEVSLFTDREKLHDETM
jgi:hypothetical protein